MTAHLTIVEVSEAIHRPTATSLPNCLLDTRKMSDRSPHHRDDLLKRGSGERSLDRETIQEVLRDHPVRLAVLFGSQVTDTADAQSDIDIAVELTEEAHDSPLQAVMDLLTDLSIALDRNDIDLSLVSDLTPRVGRAAFSEGELLVGSPERAEHHREHFEQRVTEQSRADLRERFDAVLENVDATVRE